MNGEYPLDPVKALNLTSTSWIKKRAQGYLHLTYPFILAFVLPPTTRKYEGQQAQICLCDDSDLITGYLNDYVLKQTREEFFEKIKKDDALFESTKNEFYHAVSELEAVMKEIDMIDLSTLEDAELVDLHLKFFETYVTEFKYFCTLGEAVGQQSVDYINPVFEKKLGKDFDAIFPVLTQPSRPSFIEEESRDREVLISEYRRTGTVPEEALRAHADKYFFISNNYARGVKLSASDFLALIKEDATNKQKSTDTTPPANKEALIKTYALGEEELFLLRMVDEFFKLIDDRKKNMMKASYYQLLFLSELERRTGIPLSLLKWSIHPEFKLLLAGQLSTSVLEQRSSGAFVVLSDDLSPQVLSGRNYIAVKEYFEKESKIDSKEIRGTIASPGKITGAVKLVLKIEDMVKMLPGDILVASMTRPEVVPAMKKAGAIVTDEGGITCHAAIISRELGVPCVIGTKSATKVLKDGDLVEVNANRGIVTIIKRAS